MMTRKQQLISLIEAATANTCVEWPHCISTRDGYSWVWSDGKMQSAHRFAFEHANRRPIQPGMYILHGCDNRLCVNPFHLREGTQQHNILDKYERARENHVFGEQHPRSRLTEDLVRYIRASELTVAQLSKQLSIPRSTIADIRKRKTWKHI